MPSPQPPDSGYLRPLLERFRNGDAQAGDLLFQAASERLEVLARRMLHNFAGLRPWADSQDVVQGALTRLLRSLRSVQPISARDFLNLAAMEMRRELLDLARRFRSRPDACRRAGNDSHFLKQASAAEESREQDLDLWTALHEGIEHLPTEEREVVSLTFYHSWTQAQIAELFGVDERTIRRRWRSACQRLCEALGGRLPAS